MKMFAYTVRDQTGALKRGTRQAGDRSAILQELQAEGLIPVSVIETAPLGAGRLSMTGARLKVLYVVAILLVVGIGFWTFKGNGKREVITSMPKRDLPVSPSEALVANLQKVVPAEQKPEPQSAMQAPEPVESFKTEPAVAPAPSQDPPAQDTRAVQAKVNMSTNAAEEIRRPFTTGTDQIIAMYANVAPGFPPPPLFNLPLGENVAKMLDKDIVLYDDDEAKVVESKENTARMKQALKKYIAEGGTPETFLKYYHEALTQEYNKWKSSQQKVIEMLQMGDKAGAEKYVTEKNVELKDHGIRQIVIPPNLVNQ